MTDDSIRRLLRTVVVVAIVAGLAATVVVVAAHDGLADFVASGGWLVNLLTIVIGAVVWGVARTQPRNRLLWILCFSVVAFGLYPLFQLLIRSVWPDVAYPLDLDFPEQWPLGVAWAQGVSDAMATAGYFGFIVFGLLLFPDGRLPSRRWRWPARVVGVGLVGLVVSIALSYVPDAVPPVVSGVLDAAGFVGLFGGSVVALAGLAARYRGSGSVERRQIKWIVWGAAIFVPATILGFAFGADVLNAAGALVFLGCYGIAVARYRLFDIDIVISRTLVYASLAGFIGVVYVGVVVGVGSLFGSTDEPNAALAIGATALVAVAFQPLRRRLQRVANRLVFGRRATPYEVLSTFSRRLAATDDSMLGDAARWLVEGTGAARAVISVGVDGSVVEAAVWPESADGAVGEFERFPIEHEGVELGELGLVVAPGQTLSGEDRRLAGQVASGMGLALRNRLLTQALQGRVEELRESRRRLVALQDETRRRIERDLHDGAQQQLVALKVKLGLSRAIAEKDGALRTAQFLTELGSEADGAVDAMRTFARGVYPPLLEAEGLSSAVRAQARRSSVPVTVEADGIGRYPRQIESTVYFCVTEALANVTRYADASAVVVGLGAHDGSVEFRVRDDGVGFDPSHTDRGPGLINMEDRIDAVNGTLTVVSAPGEGTEIRGTIPTRIEVPA